MKPTRATPWQRVGTFERRVRWTPGYDCRAKCEHEVKGEHGQHGDELRLEVRLPDAAVSMLLFTHVRDGKATYRSDRHGLVTPAYVNYHFAFRPNDHEQGQDSSECDVLKTGRCFDQARGLTSITERDGERWKFDGWLWGNADHAAVNDEAFLVHPEVEHLVLALPSGIWERLQADLVEWRGRALGGP